MKDEISKERILASIDLMAMLVVEELENTTHKKQDELIVKLLNSTQGKMLYDDSTKLWTTSPCEIASKILKG